METKALLFLFVLLVLSTFLAESESAISGALQGGDIKGKKKEKGGKRSFKGRQRFRVSRIT